LDFYRGYISTDKSMREQFKEILKLELADNH